MRRRTHGAVLFGITCAILLGIGFVMAHPAAAQGVPGVSVTLGDTADPKQTATSMQILLLFTILSIAPAILISVTSFTRLIIVFSFLRQAMGTQQMPPNQIMVSLALFLSFFIMSPVITQIDQTAVRPMMAGEITQTEAMNRGSAPLKEFMLTQTREKDLALFVQMSRTERPATVKELPMSVVIPSFMISELRTAFQIGFVIYLPFLIIDLIVSSVLMSMGMMMIPPAMISLPFKVLLFVLVDGWSLICHSMVQSFHL